ncbi:SAF domain-containing protein [Arthrobacter sp. zg-Y769]|uniref:SAF domain-containing protein n=1 Tax=Arthrobacter sp. zg-Y769 TaxID=2894191 RepID=UPI001E2F4110|nr:SAF domain-containing protein [Arthrobacter sp. zg-Y769]MCC9203604.1 SAF domain-containing protein [Arthrobacter sp. zg-Y769]
MSLHLTDRVSGEEPAAARLRKPSWRDPRLLLGILLVLGSVAGVVTLVDSADRTTEVYAAKRDIPPGTPVRAEDLHPIPVRLGNAEQLYLPVAAGIPENAVAGAALRAGELVAGSSLIEADSLDRKPVGLRVEDPLPASTDAGSRVDIWAAMPNARNGFDEPEQLIEAAEISELTVTESALGASRSTELLVLVDDSDLPLLLSALSNQAKITVVHNPSPGS